MVGNPVPAGIHPTVALTEKQGREYGCANVDRVRRMREICRQTQSQKYQYTARTAQNDKTFLIYIDADRKLLYCRIGKVGSTSFVNFLEQTTRSTYNSTTSTNLQHGNMESFQGVPVEEINTKYKDYTKIVVVRHPLQRVVSAYHQVINSTMRRRKLRENNRTEPMTLDDFLRNVTGKWRDANIHWMRYQKSCKLCFIRYHYVIQTETMESDMSKMAGVFRDERNPSRKAQLKHKNFGVGNKSQIFKHDHFLREFQLKYPTYMQRLLSYYGDDMQLFDYGWDSDKMMSLCRNSTKSPKCCS